MWRPVASFFCRYLNSFDHTYRDSKKGVWCHPSGKFLRNCAKKLHKNSKATQNFRKFPKNFVLQNLNLFFTESQNTQDHIVLWVLRNLSGNPQDVARGKQQAAEAGLGPPGAARPGHVQPQPLPQRDAAREGRGHLRRAAGRCSDRRLGVARIASPPPNLYFRGGALNPGSFTFWGRKSNFSGCAVRRWRPSTAVKYLFLRQIFITYLFFVQSSSKMDHFWWKRKVVSTQNFFAFSWMALSYVSILGGALYLRGFYPPVCPRPIPFAQRPPLGRGFQVT